MFYKDVVYVPFKHLHVIRYLTHRLYCIQDVFSGLVLCRDAEIRTRAVHAGRHQQSWKDRRCCRQRCRRGVSQQRLRDERRRQLPVEV